MCIPVATQDASAKHYKGSVSEKIPGMFVGLCDTAKYSIRCLRVMLMLDVSGEQSVGINVLRSFVFRELLLHYCPVRLLSPPFVFKSHYCKGKSTADAYGAALGV